MPGTPGRKTPKSRPVSAPRASLTPLQLQKQRRAQIAAERIGAAQRIQRQWRRYLGSETLRLKRYKVVCAVVIQRRWRRHVREHNATVAAQFKQWLAARRRDITHRWQFAARRIVLYTRWARKIICQWILFYITRRKLLRRRQARMSVKIQRQVRGYLHRLHTHFLIEFADEQKVFLRYWKVCHATLVKEEAARFRGVTFHIGKLIALEQIIAVEKWKASVGWTARGAGAGAGPARPASAAAVGGARCDSSASVRPVRASSERVDVEEDTGTPEKVPAPRAVGDSGGVLGDSTNVQQQQPGGAGSCAAHPGLVPAPPRVLSRPASALKRSEVDVPPAGANFGVVIPRRPNSAAMRRRPF